MSGEQPTSSQQETTTAPPAPEVQKETVKLYLAPGRTADLDTWDCLDIQLWMTCFTAMEDREETFLNMMHIGMTGSNLVCLSNGWGQRRWGQYVGFKKHVFENLLKHAARVMEEFLAIKQEIKIENDD